MGWSWNISALLWLLGSDTFQQVNEIEIFVDLEDTGHFKRTVLLDFIDALCAIPGTRPGRFIFKFTVAIIIEEVRVFYFLRALREVPGFEDANFKLENSCT